MGWEGCFVALDNLGQIDNSFAEIAAHTGSFERASLAFVETTHHRAVLEDRIAIQPSPIPSAPLVAQFLNTSKKTIERRFGCFVVYGMLFCV